MGKSEIFTCCSKDDKIALNYASCISPLMKLVGLALISSVKIMSFAASILIKVCAIDLICLCEWERSKPVDVLLCGTTICEW